MTMTLLIEHEPQTKAPAAWDWTAWLRRVWPSVAPSEFDEPHCPHCGSALLDLVHRIAKPRSLPQHKRLFVIIAEAMKHWPEGYEEFQPECEEHLRAFLICRAGPEFRETHRVYITPENMPNADISPDAVKLFCAAAQSTMNSVREHGARYSFLRPHATEPCWAVYVPLSMSFRNMAHLRFCALNNAIEAVLRDVGLDPETLLMERHFTA